MLRILVVDDDPMIQLVLRGYLQKWGHEVQVTSSAAEALDSLSAEAPFDLIMSDLVMPIMDGLEFARLAKQLYPKSHFILITGFAGRLETTDRSCVDLVMTKPFSYEEIGAGLATVFPRTSKPAAEQIF